jgi:hypothetical protein
MRASKSDGGLGSETCSRSVFEVLGKRVDVNSTPSTSTTASASASEETCQTCHRPRTRNLQPRSKDQLQGPQPPSIHPTSSDALPVFPAIPQSRPSHLPAQSISPKNLCRFLRWQPYPIRPVPAQTKRLNIAMSISHKDC